MFTITFPPIGWSPTGFPKKEFEAQQLATPFREAARVLGLPRMPNASARRNPQENQRRALRWLWSNPSRGGAAKRWMMWLRWFVRSDSIDPGGHEALGAHRLVMPLDVHVFRLVRYMKLTQYNTASSRAALDVTRSFRPNTPKDPLRYDFSLSRIGILGHCPGRKSASTCAGCALYVVCRA